MTSEAGWQHQTNEQQEYDLPPSISGKKLSVLEDAFLREIEKEIESLAPEPGESDG